MRFVFNALVGLVSLMALVSPVSGQPGLPPADSNAVPLPRWRVGVAADIGQPVGAFKRNVGNAAGMQAHALLRLDRHGVIALRLQGGWLNYGSESQRTCLGTTPGCRLAVNVTTANGILSAGVGPELSFPLGAIRAYGFGLVGVSRFATVSGLGGGLVPDVLAADENFGDAGLLWSGGIGLQIPVRRSTTIDAGVAFQGHGRRDYLVEGGVTDRPDGSLAFDIKRSQANLYAIRVGMTTAMPWSRRQSSR